MSRSLNSLGFYVAKTTRSTVFHYAVRSEQLLVHSLIGWACCSVPPLSITLKPSARVVERIIPSEKWYISFAGQDWYRLCCSATIDSARLVKGRFPCIVPLSWHAREGRESDRDSFHGSLCANQSLKNPSRSFC